MLNTLDKLKECILIEHCEYHCLNSECKLDVDLKYHTFIENFEHQVVSGGLENHEISWLYDMISNVCYNSQGCNYASEIKKEMDWVMCNQDLFKKLEVVMKDIITILKKTRADMSYDHNRDVVSWRNEWRAFYEELQHIMGVGRRRCETEKLLKKVFDKCDMDWAPEDNKQKENVSRWLRVYGTYRFNHYIENDAVAAYVESEKFRHDMYMCGMIDYIDELLKEQYDIRTTVDTMIV